MFATSQVRNRKGNRDTSKGGGANPSKYVTETSRQWQGGIVVIKWIRTAVSNASRFGFEPQLFLNIRKEAVQVAAMAIRIIQELT